MVDYKTQSPESSAQDILDKVFGHMDSIVQPPVCIDTILSFIGILPQDDPSLHKKGLISEMAIADGEVNIKLNPKENSYESRRRFTIAHQIGHLILHGNKQNHFQDTIKTMSFSGAYWSDTESQANSFALELLIPAGLAHEEIEAIENDLNSSSRKITKERLINLMASTFNVPNKVMDYKLKLMRVFDNKGLESILCESSQVHEP